MCSCFFCPNRIGAIAGEGNRALQPTRHCCPLLAHSVCRPAVRPSISLACTCLPRPDRGVQRQAINDGPNTAGSLSCLAAPELLSVLLRALFSLCSLTRPPPARLCAIGQEVGLGREAQTVLDLAGDSGHRARCPFHLAVIPGTEAAPILLRNLPRCCLHDVPTRRRSADLFAFRVLAFFFLFLRFFFLFSFRFLFHFHFLFLYLSPFPLPLPLLSLVFPFSFFLFFFFPPVDGRARTYVYNAFLSPCTKDPPPPRPPRPSHRDTLQLYQCLPG